LATNLGTIRVTIHLETIGDGLYLHYVGEDYQLLAILDTESDTDARVEDKA